MNLSLRKIDLLYVVADLYVDSIHINMGTFDKEELKDLLGQLENMVDDVKFCLEKIKG